MSKEKNCGCGGSNSGQSGNSQNKGSDSLGSALLEVLTSPATALWEISKGTAVAIGDTIKDSAKKK